MVKALRFGNQPMLSNQLAIDPKAYGMVDSTFNMPQLFIDIAALREYVLCINIKSICLTNSSFLLLSNYFQSLVTIAIYFISFLERDKDCVGFISSWEVSKFISLGLVTFLLRSVVRSRQPIKDTLKSIPFLYLIFCQKFVLLFASAIGSSTVVCIAKPEEAQNQKW